MKALFLISQKLTFLIIYDNELYNIFKNEQNLPGSYNFFIISCCLFIR